MCLRDRGVQGTPCYSINLDVSDCCWHCHRASGVLRVCMSPVFFLLAEYSNPMTQMCFSRTQADAALFVTDSTRIWNRRRCREYCFSCRATKATISTTTTTTATTTKDVGSETLPQRSNKSAATSTAKYARPSSKSKSEGRKVRKQEKTLISEKEERKPGSLKPDERAK